MAERAAARARFNEIDTIRDEKLSRKEVRVWLEKTSAKDWLQRVPDSGKATADQIFRREFDRMDSNHDGVITPGELDQSLQ